LRGIRLLWGSRAPFTAERLGAGPIVASGQPGLEGERGASVNGPSLVRVPDWLPDPLGRYYLYFAHHQGREIRLAYAERLEGPWTVADKGVLSLDETAARGHIASPDVHIDRTPRRLRMYFHGCVAGTADGQASFLATSDDGLRFTAHPEILAPFYLRVFEHGGAFYGIVKKGNVSGALVRSPDGLRPFEEGPRVIPRMRHAAVLSDRAAAWIVYSRIGDAPESMLAARIDLTGDWRSWRPGRGAVVLAPERAYEGADEPRRPSRPGIARDRVRELRDPALYVEGDRVFLVYAVAGEQGLGLAELHRRER
jgi:hypothetical protein